MKRGGYQPTNIVYQRKPAMPRKCWSFLTLVGPMGIMLLCMGSVMYVMNQKLESEMMKMRSSLLNKNYLLNNRIKRNIMTSSNRVYQSHLVRENDEEVMTMRKKRSSSSVNEPEVIQTPRFETGITYERWGRRECSGPNNELIYKGIAISSWYASTGGASNFLCLHMNVTYSVGHYIDGSQAAAHIHGVEYRDMGDWTNQLFDLSLTENNALNYHSVPCAICMATARYNKLMIPGRQTCPEGWHLEYTGYIMSGALADNHSSEAICVDDTPQLVPGTQGSQHGAHLHLAETRCESLPCEPFVVGRELRCVVCTI